MFNFLIEVADEIWEIEIPTVVDSLMITCLSPVIH